MNEALLECIDAAGMSGQPAPLYHAIDRALGTLVGHKLFTLMVLDRASERVRRVYSNQPSAYPVGGFKTHRQTPWGRQVLGEGRSYIGRDANDIRWAFADADLIASLSCESVLNVPVRWNGDVLGTINLLDSAHRYGATHIEMVQPFGALLIPAFQLEIVRG